MDGNFNNLAFNDSIFLFGKVNKVSFVPDYEIGYVSIVKVII